MMIHKCKYSDSSHINFIVHKEHNNIYIFTKSLIKLTKKALPKNPVDCSSNKRNLFHTNKYLGHQHGMETNNNLGTWKNP